MTPDVGEMLRDVRRTDAGLSDFCLDNLPGTSRSLASSVRTYEVAAGQLADGDSFTSRWLELDNHRLGLQVVGEDLLAHLTAPAALLEAAERQLRAVHVVGIDPHGARLETLGELVGL